MGKAGSTGAEIPSEAFRERESILNQKLEEKIPPKLQKTLDTAFAKAFALIFEKGTGVIERRISGQNWSRIIRCGSIWRM